MLLLLSFRFARISAFYVCACYDDDDDDVVVRAQPTTAVEDAMKITNGSTTTNSNVESVSSDGVPGVRVRGSSREFRP